MKKIVDKIKKFYNSVLGFVEKYLLKPIYFFLVCFIIWSCFNMCPNVDTASAQEEFNPFSGFIEVNSEEVVFDDFFFQSNDTLSYYYVVPELSLNRYAPFFRMMIEPFYYDNNISFNSIFAVETLDVDNVDFTVAMSFSMDYFDISNTFYEYRPNPFYFNGSYEDIVYIDLWDYFIDVVPSSAIYVSYFEVYLYIVPSSLPTPYTYDMDVDLLYSTEYSYEEYLVLTADYIQAHVGTGVSIKPISDEIIYLATNLTQIQILPNFRIIDLLLIATIIPITIMTLKLWLGG